MSRLESLEEYADRITAAWPLPSSAQTARISSLLNTAAILSVTDFQTWEIRRHLLEAETPGKFGTYGFEDAA